MLQNILETKTTEFSDLEAGLHYLRTKSTKQVIVPGSALEVTQDGMLRSRNSREIEARMTDFSLGLLHDILRIPRTYAQRLDPALHATNINELLSKRVSPLVVINEEGAGGANAHVTAVIPSQPVVIPHEVILGHLVEKRLPGRVFFAPGYMEARVAGQDAVEILPQDAFSIEGLVLNSQLGHRKWPFEISSFLTRLVCSNGMVARRNILSGKLAMWTQNPQRLGEYLDRQLEGALNILACGLKAAMERMAAIEVGEEEKKGLIEQVRRAAGVKFLEGLFEKAVTMYDHFNDVTNLANRLEDRERQRRLWVLGGGMVEKFLEGN